MRPPSLPASECGVDRRTSRPSGRRSAKTSQRPAARSSTSSSSSLHELADRDESLVDRWVKSPREGNDEDQLEQGRHRWLTVVAPDDPAGVELVLEPDEHPAA